MTDDRPPQRTLASLPEAEVLVTELGDGRRRVRTIATDPTAYIHRHSVETTYPDSLLWTIMESKGVGFLCDEIARDQDPNYLERHLVAAVAAHVDPDDLGGGTVLDFGCGAGASTSILGRLLPKSSITGVELEESFLTVARARADFYGFDHVRFILSPSPDRLPDFGEPFDAVVLSAVFEHLLPNERRSLMPKLWGLVKPGGLLFIDETPWRWFPVETHTTGIPLLNYLPDSAAVRAARRSPKVRGRKTWPELLRAGVRGGTASEILRSLGGPPDQAEVLQPSRLGLNGWVDLWYEGYASGNSGRFHGLKRSAGGLLRTIERTTGVSAVPYLSLAIRKLPN